MKNFVLLILITIFIFGEECEINRNKYKISSIDCYGVGLSKLDKSWLKISHVDDYIDLANNHLSNVNNLKNLTSVFKLHLEDNPELNDISGLKNIESIYLLYLDNKEYKNKLPKFSWICNHPDRLYLISEDSDYICVTNKNIYKICE